MGHRARQHVQAVQSVADDHGELVAVVRQRAEARGVSLMVAVEIAAAVFAPLKTLAPSLGPFTPTCGRHPPLTVCEAGDGPEKMETGDCGPE